jgi:putative cardiolipin synthase
MRSVFSAGFLAVLVVAAGIGGCAGVDFDHPRTPSQALEPGFDTRLGRQVREVVAAHPEKSGFYPIYDGVEALATRLLLADRAERAIDAQTYILLADVSGYLYLDHLLKAADRGVRVRLLLDDFTTQGYDRGMAALDAHPSFELRVFNPFSRRTGRMLDFVTESGRINRRMHNKSFTVDGVATVVGGRNIGDEYFAVSEKANEGDFDVLAAGPVARDVGEAFDSYWNSEMVVPASALRGAPDDPEAELALLRGRIAAALAELGTTQLLGALDESLREKIAQDVDSFVWAPYRVVYAAPERGVDTMATPLIDAIEGSQQELLLVSPYFVPLESGVERFRKLRERGVRVVIVTNSLASTDVIPAHAGYAQYRKALLEQGVELHEVRPDVILSGTERAGTHRAHSGLHAKAFVVDRRLLFVGSFNWDPRSMGINTEMGLLIDSPELANQIATGVEAALARTTYRVTLNEKGKLRWIGREHGETVTFDGEPHTGFWRRFQAGFAGLLPIEDQL